MKNSHEYNTINRASKAFELMKGKFLYKNINQAPKLVKAVISTGVGSIKDNRKVELIADRLSKITGQKPAIRTAKKSIASFKTRQGDKIGYQITLRGKNMYSFLDKVIHIALPRTKDFRGISKLSIDEMGNYTFGIREHTIFPETSDEELKDVFGLAITIVTTAQNREEALAFLEIIGLPFKQKDDAKESKSKPKSKKREEKKKE